jgi:enoyl-CoA hydratase/carnithine racemase
MAADLLFEKDGSIATITFNRPERRNALNRDVMNQLEALIRQVRDDRDIAVLIVTAAGSVFSAGADTSVAKGVTDPQERARRFAEYNAGLPRMIGRIFDQIVRLDCMTVGSLNGDAIGGGWALALAFDFAIAVEEAEFWLPEVDLGMPYTGGPALALAARLGPWRAKEAMIQCRRYKARELFELGLINRVVKQDDLAAATRELAQSLAKKPRGAAKATKHFIDGIILGPRLY